MGWIQYIKVMQLLLKQDADVDNTEQQRPICAASGFVQLERQGSTEYGIVLFTSKSGSFSILTIIEHDDAQFLFFSKFLSRENPKRTKEMAPVILVPNKVKGTQKATGERTPPSSEM